MHCSSGIALGVAVLVAAFAGHARAQTVDEVVAKNLEARGGVDKLKALTTAKIIGDVVRTNTTDSRRHLCEASAIRYAPRRGIPRPPGMPGPAGGTMKWVVAFDGTNVWMTNSLLGDAPQAITGPRPT